MDPKEAVEQLVTIRRIMESATELTVLPGAAAAGGGLLSLGGCVLTYTILHSFDFAQLGQASKGIRASVIALWVGIGLLGVVLDLVLVARRARRRGKNPWYRLGQLAARVMGPAVVAALAVSLALAFHNLWGLIPGVWMLLYGSAVWTTGLLSVHNPGALGLVFVGGGVAALLLAPAYSLLLVGLTFGVAHIAYGLYARSRFGE